MKGMIFLIDYFYRMNDRRRIGRAMVLGAALGATATLAVINLINRKSLKYDANEDYMNDEGEVDITVETFPLEDASSEKHEVKESYATIRTHEEEL